MFMIRVLGGLFTIYRIPVTKALQRAVSSGDIQHLETTTVYKFGGMGLDPTVADDRFTLLRSLDMLLQVVGTVANVAARRNSNSPEVA